MLDRHLRARVIVVGDAVHRGRARPRGRRARSALRGWRCRITSSSSTGLAEDHAVRAQLQQRLHGVRLRARAARLPVLTSTLYPVRAACVLDPGHDVGEEGIVQVGDHHAHEVRAPLHEAARHRVRPIAELGRRPGHGLPAAGAHVIGAPHDQRDEGLRHAGAPRHVGDRRLARLDLGSHWNVPPEDDALYAKYRPARKAGRADAAAAQPERAVQARALTRDGSLPTIRCFSSSAGGCAMRHRIGAGLARHGAGGDGASGQRAGLQGAAARPLSAETGAGTI